MNIYLCGSCGTEDRTMMKRVADVLRKKHDVYCPFEIKIENAWDYTQEDWANLVFNADVPAIDKADRVIAISMGRVSTAGTNWEIGYAYAKGKPVTVVQYTDATTSLMVYCGCESFINTTS